jgi:deoxyribodipyrimidine photo-lyase
MKSIFIFRRDLRMFDNTALIEAYKNSSTILAIFIFTPEQIVSNEYFSVNAFQFMIESLEELNEQIPINYFYGENVEVLEKLLKDYNYTDIFFNMDYTPYARERDENILKFCERNDVKCHTYEDYLLLPIGTVLKSDNQPYQKYTPFKNKFKTFKVEIPKSIDKNKKFQKIKTDFSLEEEFKFNKNILFHGGRKHALKILENIKNFKEYGENRNNLSTLSTHLSSYLKFGTVSVREVYHNIINNFDDSHTLISQLIWREFYYYLAYYFPQVLKGKSLKSDYDNIEWENNPEIIQAWKNGMTGFPGVDAGMREMNETGFMHNRARLITSGILIKILNCDWRLGEKYFAQKLIDYDPAINNGNWQWSSGSGADSQPYFRILSPWKQVADYDPECEYIKKWIPELRNIPNKDILTWGKSWTKYIKTDKKDFSYPKPIVDYDKMRKSIVETYKKGLY